MLFYFTEGSDSFFREPYIRAMHIEAVYKLTKTGS
jgi:hypothetical protein